MKANAASAAPSEDLIAFDVAEMLKTDEMIAVFLDEAFKTGEAAYIAHSLGIAARAKSMIKVAQDSGLCREQLYRSFSEQGNPTLRSLLAVMQAMGLRLAVQPRQPLAA